MLPDDTFAALVPAGRIVFGGPRDAAAAFVGRHPKTLAAVPSANALPGRLERRRGEIRDGAHNPDGVAWLCTQLADSSAPAPLDYTVCASILVDKDADAMLRGLATLGSRFVATASSYPLSLAATELATRARRFFTHVETVDEPAVAVQRAHELGEPVLITGSLYLLSDLEAASTP